MKKRLIRQINRMKLFLVDEGGKKPYFAVHSPDGRILEEFHPGNDKIPAAVRAKAFMDRTLDFVTARTAWSKTKVLSAAVNATTSALIGLCPDRSSAHMGSTGASHRSPFGPGA
jgi:hypothetical protein